MEHPDRPERILHAVEHILRIMHRQADATELLQDAITRAHQLYLEDIICGPIDRGIVAGDDLNRLLNILIQFDTRPRSIESLIPA
jgi:hypothetical protein